MSVVKFIKDASIQNCKLIQMSEHVIKVELSQAINVEVVLGGFEVLNEHNFTVMGIYHDYNTIYETLEEESDLVYVLSDDGSTKPKPVPVPEPEPYVPTLEEMIKSKVYEINSACQYAITTGVDIEIYNEVEHFSYTIEDQANIDDIAQMARATGMEQSYHCDNGSCKLYTIAQINELYMKQKMNKAHNITYANQLKLYVKSLTDKEEVSAVVYGTELTGEYLETYNTIMAHEQEVAKAVIGVVNE